MKQIADTVYEWSQYDPQRRLDLNGHFVQAAPGEPGVLIDPVPFHPGDEAQIRELGGVSAVVLSNGRSAARVQQASRCRELFGCTVLVPASDLADLTIPSAEPFDAESTLPAGLRVIGIPGDASTQGVALYQQSGECLFAGWLIVGSPVGRLSLPPGPRSDDPSLQTQKLRALLSVPRLRHLLLAEGNSIHHEIARALQDLQYQHDPAAFKVRLEDVNWGSGMQGGTKYAVRNALVSRLVGLQELDFDLSEIPSGRMNYPLHRHDGKEELFIVLEGHGEVRTESGTFPISPGDVLAFAPRYQLSHVIKNTGVEPLRFLSFATQAEALEMIDYPDTGQHATMTPFGKRRRFFLPERTNVGYWEGTPL